MKFARGGAEAAKEAELMVAEKIRAVFELQAKAASGALGASSKVASQRTLAHYRRAVRANRKRLSRSS